MRTVILSNFTEKELAFLRTQRLGRLATVSPEGRPQIAPVMYQYNAALDTIEIGGANLNKSKKFRNILKTPYLAFVIDEVIPPWNPRGVEVRGAAEAIEGSADSPDTALIRISVEQIIGWGLDDPNPYVTNNRRVK